MPTKRVFGIILTYNCALFLPEVISKIPKEYFDIIIVSDDDSSDNTMDVAKQLGVQAFTHPHTGYGGNLKFGLNKAVEMGADHMIEIHGDGQYDLFSVPLAIPKLNAGVDFILGNRFYKFFQPWKDNMSLIRILGNLTLSTIGRFGLWIKPLDLFPGFRAYSKRFVETIDFANGSDDYFFSFEVIVLAKYAGLVIDSVPARCFYNKGGHSSMNLWKGMLEIYQTPHAVLQYWLALLGWKRTILKNQGKLSLMK
ncbi:MAG: glycosyltransferase family 2 protein [Candidatus Vogelbacteria bacterium]|nr:glycosyltransferase family 2 protein [Candidatus Vogelbacteria bacterium]